MPGPRGSSLATVLATVVLSVAVLLGAALLLPVPKIGPLLAVALIGSCAAAAVRRHRRLLANPPPPTAPAPPPSTLPGRSVPRDQPSPPAGTSPAVPAETFDVSKLFGDSSAKP